MWGPAVCLLPIRYGLIDSLPLKSKQNPFSADRSEPAPRGAARVQDDKTVAVPSLSLLSPQGSIVPPGPWVHWGHRGAVSTFSKIDQHFGYFPRGFNIL